MTISRFAACAAILLLAAGCGGPGESADVPEAQPAGATFEDIGDCIVHFSAQTTDDLPREVAQAYQIQRSPDRAMLNVSVVRESDGASVAADISVKTRNLTQQLKVVEMREVREQDAIYYIGQTKVANRETLIFELGVKPEGVERPESIRFQKQFYTD
jgi:hypothetical protein